MNKITTKLVELINIGRVTSVEDLVSMRGEVGDFPRGASAAFAEVIDYIRTGEGLYEETDA
jgi:hypothetical protein